MHGLDAHLRAQDQVRVLAGVVRVSCQQHRSHEHTAGSDGPDGSAGNDAERFARCFATAAKRSVGQMLLLYCSVGTCVLFWGYVCAVLLAAVLLCKCRDVGKLM